MPTAFFDATLSSTKPTEGIVTLTLHRDGVPVQIELVGVATVVHVAPLSTDW